MLPQARPKKKKPKFAYWMLVMATALGILAAVTYLVPIPGLTQANAATTPPATSPAKQEEKTAEKPPADERAAALDKAEAEMKAREEKLKEQEAQVASLLKELTRPKSDGDALARVAAMYENMPPFKAGPMLQTLDSQTAVAILRLIDEDQAAVILTYMDKAKGAALLSELAKPPSSKNGGKE